MARRRGQAVNDGLREWMAERAELSAARWSARARSDAERAYVERTAGAMAGRWRSDEPIEVAVWELPDWATGTLPASRRVVVHSDGTLEVPDLLGEGVVGEVVVLRHPNR